VAGEAETKSVDLEKTAEKAEKEEEGREGEEEEC